jgi:hypothetical protein
MKYVIDTSSLRLILKSYYKSIFTSFWEKFDLMIQEEKITSICEVKNEIESYGGEDSLNEWAKKILSSLLLLQKKN